MIEIYDCPNLSEMISDYLAAIISKNLEEFEISKSHFKKIYSIRSDISHGTVTDVLGGDLLYAKWYTMDLIKKFIADREIEHFTKNISFAEYNDDIVRYLVERIYITEDYKLVINMKGGDTVVEEIYPIE